MRQTGNDSEPAQSASRSAEQAASAPARTSRGSVSQTYSARHKSLPLATRTGVVVVVVDSQSTCPPFPRPGDFTDRRLTGGVTPP